MNSTDNIPKNITEAEDTDRRQKTGEWLIRVIEDALTHTGEAYRQLRTISFGILTLEILGELQRVPIETRLIWEQDLQAFQNPDDGVFSGSPVVESTDTSSIHFHQTFIETFFATQALAALHSQAVHQVKLPPEFLDIKSVDNWLDRLDWSNAHLASEQVMAFLGVLIYLVEKQGDIDSATLYHTTLDKLQTLQDPKTGLWGTQNGDSLKHALVTGFHLLTFFSYVHRPIRHLSRIIDCAFHLLLSNPKLFTTCDEDFYAGLAATYLLSSFATRTLYCQDEIGRLLPEINHTLRSGQQEDGSFQGFDHEWSQSNHCYQSLVKLLGPDMVFCTWLHEIGLAASGTVGGMPSQYKLRQGQPVFGRQFHGVHLSDHQEGTDLLWLRPFHFKNADTEDTANDDQPVISVVIPVYNQGPYLYEAVQSVLDQTYQNFEIIIVNDGSTDAYTNLLLSNIHLPKTRVVHQSNHGLAGARNSGIRQAHGKFICCLDADDCLRPAYFASAIPLLDAEPETGIVTGLFEAFDDAEGIFQCHEFDLPDLLAENRVIEPAIFRKEAWEKAGGYFERFSHSGIEDWDLWISIYEAGYSAHFLDEVLYDYRIRTDSMSAAMYQPHIWSPLILELVNRHLTSYTKHFGAVMSRLGGRWVELRNWARSQDGAAAWWERQSGTWQYAAEKKDQEILNMQAWIRELENRIAELETQVASSNERRGTLQWINPEQSGLFNKIWYALGKRLGVIISGIEEKGRQND